MRKLLYILLFISIQCYAQIPGVVATTNYTTTPDTTGAINDTYIIIDDAVMGTGGYEFNYVGNWPHGANVAGWYPETGDPKQTLSYSSITNDSLTFTFNGTGVELYAETHTHLGIAAVSIDGGADTNVDLYAASGTQQVMVFQNLSLTQSVHTLSFRVTGTKNASSSNYYCIIDYIKVINPEEVPPLPPTPTYLYLATTGNNANTPCTSAGAPCQTIAFINTIAVSGDTVSMAAGTYTEAAVILPPLGVTYIGAGINQTIVKGNTSLNHTFVYFVLRNDKYLFQYITPGTGNQGIMDMTIEGNSRGMHGGVYLDNVDNVDFTRVRFENFGYAALHLLNHDDIDMTDVQIVNCSLSLTQFSTGGLMISSCTNMTIDNVFIDETALAKGGYGIKAFGPPNSPVIDNLQIINPTVNVTAQSNYGTGNTANIAIELWNCLLTDALVQGGTLNNNISLVKPDGQTDPGTHAITVDGLTMNPIAGYCMELLYHNAEIKNCYFNGGRHASIYNTDATGGPRCTNWDIHHNVFFNPNLAGNQGAAIRNDNNGFLNMEVYNNTFHWLSTSVNNSVMLTKAGTSTNIQFKNNLVYDQTSAVVMSLDGGSTVSASTFSYNQFWGLTQGSLSGVTYSNNLTSDPLLSLTLPKPAPYYRITTGSPASESGTPVGLPYSGANPSRGAMEIDPN